MGKEVVCGAKTNPAASLYYFASLLHGEAGEWGDALNCIEESLARSEDHYWRYFYVRGMLLACVHNFGEALRDLNAAVSLSEGGRA